jgi:tetratricopeptide (TPR) repeat protein
MAVPVAAQGTQAYIERIDMLRTQIKTAEQQQAGAAEVGGLWLQLANRYVDMLEFPQAEDAFARSLRLLRTPATQAAYAAALDGMGSLYLETGRLNDAGEYSRKSLEIYTALGDQMRAATLHDTIALVAFSGRHYREAEAEAALGVTEMQTVAKPDAGELVTAYLIHSYALCSQGRCSEALGDVDRAMAVAEANLRPEAIEMAGIWLARGYDRWKAGAPADAASAMSEALRIVRGHTELPQPALVGMELGVMRQYDAFLKGTHRKPQQKQLEAEMARLQAEQPPACDGCTVSVAALAPGLRP